MDSGAADSSAGPRARAFLLLPLVLILAAGGWWWVHRGVQETDDAQVQADLTDIASRIPGTIATVSIHDNQTVHRGQLLLTLDRRDAEAAVHQAEADLQVARSEAAAQRSQADSSLNAAHAAGGEAQAGHLAARAELERAETDLQRMERLVAQGAVAVQEADAARATYQKALAADRQSAAQHDAALARESLVRVEGQRAVAARARVDQAAATLARARIHLGDTRIVAPADGRIGSRSAEPGRQVQPGQPLMVLVSPHPWVEAHFKETQLGALRPGQPVTLHVDAFPGRVFHGRLQSLAPASGARFSLLPPDNATGNFTKVVQRVTARISIDDARDFDRLVPGLSATVQVHPR